MSEFTDQNSKNPPKADQKAELPATSAVSEEPSDEQLIQLAREALAAASASSGATNEQIRQCGKVLFQSWHKAQRNQPRGR